MLVFSGATRRARRDLFSGRSITRHDVEVGRGEWYDAPELTRVGIVNRLPGRLADWLSWRMPDLAEGCIRAERASGMQGMYEMHRIQGMPVSLPAGLPVDV